ncbi:MAG: maleylpyruvate isomerase family mycothiol-dependent enzyme [Ilumatobacteraceae bacterium]|nr:maleylpyruvate isomerase family mycothiol-dependent enzyme [Ilumatobacteraceae bacterium]
MIPHETIDKLAATWQSLSTLGQTLTEEQWKTFTQLPRWTVQDNLSHLVAFEANFQGIPRPQHIATEKSHVKNELGSSNEDDVDVRRSLSGAQVLAEWNELTALRLQALRSANADYFMRRTLALPGHQSGPSAEHTIDRLIRTLPIVIGKRAQTPEGQCVVIRITGHVSRLIALPVIDGRAQIRNEEPSSSLCDISMDSDVFLQLATGRAEYEELSSDITVSGDASHATRVLTQFTMMI